MNARRFLAAVFRGYHTWVSPLLPPACRYFPSCSVYAAEAVEAHGVFRGGFMAVRRLLRCNPWARGGFDPVPCAAHSAAADSQERA